jgi:uncharacterized membrane protein
VPALSDHAISKVLGRPSLQKERKMSYSPILLLHIASGTFGMLSGFAAVFLRKGSRRHALAGKVFVITMLSLSATGAYMALMKSQTGNVLGGTLTFYLVATAWLTARRKDVESGILDWGMALIAFTVGAVAVTYGLAAANSPTGLKSGDPAGPYFLLGSVALIAGTGDARMLLRRSISATQRLARHLWRMCFALFVAAASIFLARQQVFPALFRKTGVLFFLSFLPLMLLIFWLIRVRFPNTYMRRGPVLGVYVRPDLITRNG